MFDIKKVGVVSPAKTIYQQFVDVVKKSGVEYLKSLNLSPVFGKHVFDEWRFMAGTDKHRAEDINNFYKNKDICALFCTIAGRGTQRILPYLDYEVIKKNKKPIIGLSDITALQNALFAKCGIVSYYGFLLIYNLKDKNLGQDTNNSLQNLLNNKSFEIISGKTIKKGNAEGKIIGGCMSVFQHLLSTQYCPDFKDKILFLEDVGEYGYKIERILTQLRQQKNFDKIKGVIFGNFNSCEPKDPEDLEIDDVINDFAKYVNAPVIKDFECGHMQNGYVIPIGKKVKLVADKKSKLII